MHFCVYYVLSNGPNWEDFSGISIFGVVFGQNLGFWPPGVSTYKVPPTCYAIDIEDIASRFKLNAFLCLPFVIKWSKLGGFLHNINARGNFWSKIGFLTPGVPIFRVTLNCHAIDIEDIGARFNLNYFLCLLCVI
jgi:hypothetical protein